MQNKLSGKILLVDDNQDNLELLKAILGDFDLELETADSGLKAIKIAKTWLPDLIILDVRMPEMDGIETCEKLREIPETKNIPIMFVTAEQKDKETMMKAFNLGGDDFLSKPVSEEELIARTGVHLRLKATLDDLEKKNKILKDLSERDSLTGLLNHKALIKRLTYQCEQFFRYSNPNVTVAMIDIDFFKSLNDRYGHPFGDSVLCKVSEIIKSCIRKTDRLCRYGGDEFCAMLLNISESQSITLFKRILSKVRKEKFRVKNEKIHVTLSIGIAQMEISCEDAKSLVKRADDALYEAKQNGRNRIYGYFEIMNKDQNPENVNELARDRIVAKLKEIDGNRIHGYKQVFDPYRINILVEKLGDHLSAVADYSGAMAKELGLDEDQINHCYLSGLMHDIGAIEYRLSKSWVNLENSARILDATLSILKYDTLLSLERDYIFAHQEFYEGKGSPLGIKGKNIPLGARILAVANELDNLTPYINKTDSLINK